MRAESSRRESATARSMTTSRKIVGLAAWLGVCFLASAIGAIATADAGDFYTRLVRPTWAPPSSLFGPVWTVLYVLMGIAAWLVWLKGGFHASRTALILFLIQLAVNALWSWLFFGWRLGAASFVDVVVLWVLVVATLVSFWRRRPLAGILFVPYLLWASFAAALNVTIWRLNPGSLA